MTIKFMRLDNSYEDSDLVILQAPYQGDVSWLEGTDKGPGAIIDASLELEHFSTYLKARISEKVKIHTQGILAVKERKPEDMIKIVQKEVSRILEDGKKFALLGGDHSVSIGAINEIAKKEEEFSILHIDAHGDLRDEYLGSKYNHACVMRRAREKTKKTVSVGVRSYCFEEKELIEKEKINIYGTDFKIEEILDKLTKKVYITIDLDGFDPSEVPAVGTPQPGGLSWNQGIELIREVSKKKEIISFDIVELSPLEENKISDFFATKLLYNTIGYSFLDIPR